MKTNLLSFLVLAILVLVTKTTLQASVLQQKPFVVVLDAGHGGHDSGNLGNGYIEKNIALTIVKKAGRILAQSGIKVLYTRDDDTFVTLKGRAAVANKADADLFVSVHCDAFSNNAYGAGTFVLGLHRADDNFEFVKRENEVIFLEENYEETYAGFDPSSPETFIGMSLLQEEYLDQSIFLAGLIQNNFTNNLKRKDRSVKQAGFLVLRETYMPSVLVETGFLTNKKEGQYLNSNKGQSEIATEIANGILSYRDNIIISTSDAQNPTITEEEINEAIKTTEKKNYRGIDFRVQLAASSKKLEEKAYNFKGLKGVDRVQEDKLFKYYYGKTSDYNEIQLKKTYAQEKGYTSAYIVAFDGEIKVKLSEVLKKQVD